MKRNLFFLCLLVLLTLACGISMPASKMTLPMLQNTSYRGIYPQPVQLVDGQYEGQPYTKDGATRHILVFRSATWGKIDSDTNEDAAVILVESSGGSGSFTFLAAVLNRLGKPVNAATVSLGDRVVIQSIQIEAKVIHLQMITHGPNDPLCCPTQQVDVRYVLQGNELVKIP